MTSSRSKPRRHSWKESLAHRVNSDTIAINSVGRGDAHSLNRLSLFLRDADGVGSGRDRRVVVNVLTEQLQELIRVLADQLSQLGVARANLLQDRLEHVRLLLHHLTKLLEVLILTQEVEVAQATGGTSRTHTSSTESGGGGSCGSSAGTSTYTRRRSGGHAACPRPAPTSSGLCGGFEEVDGLILCGVGRPSWGGGGGGAGVRLGGRLLTGTAGRLSWSSLLLYAVRDALAECYFAMLQWR